MSTFSGITTASRALSAAQRGMEVTGQNIANVNTDGYSRQRVEQSASVLNQTGQFTQKFVPGDGVVVTGLSRVSDALATATARQDSAAAKEQATSATIWAGVENAIGDTGASGLSQNLADLSSAWNDLAAKSGSDGLAGAQSLVLTRSQAVVSTVNGMDGQLQSQYQQLGLQAQTLTTQANALATNVAKLNTSIRETLANGASANELMDQRDLALNQLADLTGSRVVHRDGGTVDVLVGNAALVTGDYAYQLSVSVPDPANAGQVIGNPRIGDLMVASINGQVADPATGSLKGTLDGANKTLVSQKEGLDDFATTLVSTVNTAYAQASGNPPFFGSADSSWTPGTQVDASQLKLLATSVQDSTGAPGAPGSADRANAEAVATAFAGVKTAWRTNATTLAASTQSAANRADLASQVSLKSSAVADGVSGVNLDEEMTNLVAYQHAYSAAARVLTSIDEALDTLINRTGLVGR